MQTPALAESTENTTGRPDVAAAETVYVAPPTTAPPGGTDVNAIV